MEDQEIVKEFLIESNENLGRIDQQMVELERRPKDAELLAGVFRTFHTIKGTCGFLGFSKLEQIAHLAENILSQLRSGTKDLTSPLVSLILESVDVMRRHLTAIETTGQESPEDSAGLCSRLEEANRKDTAFAAAAGAGNGNANGNGNDSDTTVQRTTAMVADTSIRVDVGLLDRLMNLVGELVLTRNQILQFSTQQDNATLNATSQRLNLITSELQEGVMKTRMQPIGLVWNKLPRMVRDLANACSKQISIEMEGADTELDKTIIEAIKDPLTHIVRNCCDHGVECPDTRASRGKPAQGRLLLRAFHEGGQVIIEISDDGGGVDIQKVKTKAVQTGVIRPDQAERMGEREALSLLFLPGFSTAAKVTNVSGRGVGMDVVRTNIERIGGTVDINSRQYEGTTVKLKIPLTLAIIPGLVVSLGDRRSTPRPGEMQGGSEQFVIPQVSLVELVRLEGDHALRSIERIRGTAVYRLRGNLLPIIYLREVLGLSQAGVDTSVVNIAVLQAEDRLFGLVVDAVKDTQEIVVKPLGKHLKGLNCYAGATIMGDGRVALILDVLGIAQKCGELSGTRERTRVEAEEQHRQGADCRQTFLLFRAGPFERLAVPLSLVARLEEFPQSKIERSGTRLVVQYRDRILPLAPLATILESGIHDTASDQDPVQAVVFDHGERRIGLLVDQLLDIVDDTVTIRHATQRRGLLGSAVIGKKVTGLLDLDTVIAEASNGWMTEEESRGEGATVMLAEGSRFSRGILRSALEMAGYKVVEAATKSEALNQLTRLKIDVVVASLDLPGGGEDFLQQMRREPSLAQLPALALASNAEEASQVQDRFEECLLRGDRDAMLRSVRRLAAALEGRSQGEPVEVKQ